MSLEIWDAPEQLYLARGTEVNPYGPLFTGDVFADVSVPGVQDEGFAIVLAHPCSMRGRGACLQPRVLMAAEAPSCDRRIACLSPFGINLLQQRFI